MLALEGTDLIGTATQVYYNFEFTSNCALCVQRKTPQRSSSSPVLQALHEYSHLYSRFHGLKLVY